MSLLLSTFSQAAQPMPHSEKYWKSEAFLNSFNGSYRTNTSNEPYLQIDERKLLISIQPLMKKGDRKGALKTLKSSKLATTSASIRFNIGNLAFELGDLKLAKSSYEEAIKAYPNFQRAHQNLAVIYLREGGKSGDKAYEHLLEALRLGGDNASLLGMLGGYHYQKGQYSAAIQAFKSARLSEPETLQWQLGVAECYRALGQLEESLSAFQAIAKKGDYNAGFEQIIADLYERLENYDEAIVTYELMRVKGKLNSGSKVRLGKLHLMKGSRTLGAKILRDVVKKKELKDPKRLLDLLEYTIVIDDLVLAKDLYKAVSSKQFKNGKSSEQQERNYRYRFTGAWIGLSSKKKQRSASVMAELIKQKPMDSHALVLLAGYESDKGNSEKALLLLDQATRGEGRYKSIAMKQKARLLVFLKRYDDALKELKRYSRIYSDRSLSAYADAVRALAEASK